MAKDDDKIPYYEDFNEELERRLAKDSRGENLFVKYRKQLLAALPVVLLVLLFLTCRGGSIEKDSPIYGDLAANYSAYVADEEGGLKELDLKSGKLKPATPGVAGAPPAPSGVREQKQKSGVVGSSPDARWAVVARPTGKAKALQQHLFDSGKRKEMPFGTDHSWKKVFFSTDSRYLFYLEPISGGFFSSMSQIFSGGFLTRNDLRPHMLVALDPETMQACRLGELPSNHFEVIVQKRD